MNTARENPFRTSRLLALPVHWGETAPETLLARWHAAGRRGALVGPHGTGKTTRLRALAARLAAEGWTVVWIQWHDDGTTTPADWRAAVRDAGPRTVVCLDGSENLGPLAAYQLHRYTRRAGGVLATRHRRSLLLPTLATYAPDAVLFAVHAAALDPAAAQSAASAFAAARGNAHEAFRALYLAQGRA
jgi:energy-coupling factor transporter ATP-binding protein EcfA2